MRRTAGVQYQSAGDQDGNSGLRTGLVVIDNIRLHPNPGSSAGWP
jgi:hypothetical protein